eukprot:14138290-Alexandrium_andersonii.AAC.1
MAEIPGHGQGIADAKAIGKPPTYAGDEESWRNWRFTLENYVACLDTLLADEMDMASNAAEPIPIGDGRTRERRN